MRLLLTAFTITLIIGLRMNECVAQRRPASPSPHPSVVALEKELRDLRMRVWELEMSARRGSYAELDTSTESYQQVKSNNATFLVAFVKAESYLNGYKVTLKIGNTTTATFNGFDLKLKWGTKEPEYSDKWSDWWRNLKSKEQHFTDELSPGRWNRLELVILPATADELGYLQVSIETNAVSLRE